MPVPPAIVYHMSLDGEWLVAPRPSLKEPYIPTSHRVELPREFYLRELRDVDIGDPQALLDFTLTYGLLPTEEWRDLPFATQHRVLAGVDVYVDLADDPLPTVPLAHAIRAEIERRDGGSFGAAGLESRSVFHLDEVKMYIETMRDMVQLSRVVQGELDPGEVTMASRATVFSSHVRSVGGAAHMLAEYLNAGLSAFSVHVAYRGEEGPDELAPYSAVRTYHACCLQLANHIAERAPYRTCPACGRLFVRKSDARYQKGQNRVYGGVTYCSSACTNRAAKQAQRRRREARTGEEGSE